MVYKYTVATSVMIFMLCILCGCSQPVYEDKQTTEDTEKDETSGNGEGSIQDEDDDIAYEMLQWEGELNKYRFEDDGSIRLYDESAKAGTAVITSRISSLRKTCWLISVRMSFNPSANNYVRFYLGASDPDLNGSLNGYFIQLGGSKEDRLYLYRQDGEETTLLDTTGEIMKGDSSPELEIKAECDSNGTFSISTSIAPYPDIHSIVFQDVTYQEAPYCGIRCTYTASNSKKVRFYSVKVHHEVDDYENLTPEEFEPSPQTAF